MRRRVRIILLTFTLVVLTIVLLSGVGIALFKGTPSWYRRSASTAGEMERFARAAENKLIVAQNWAELLRADATRDAHLRSQGATSVPAPRAQDSHVIEFTQAEIDALFEKWSTLYNWRSRYGQYVDDPRVVLQDDRIILAAGIKDLGAIASFQFHPRIDADGKLHLDLVRVAGGRLPLPDMVWTKWKDHAINSLRRQFAPWQVHAKIDASGTANFPAMAATLSRLVFAIANDRPADPVLFLPLVDRGQAVPVRVTELSASDGKLRLLVQPLSTDQREQLLQQIRSGP